MTELVDDPTLFHRCDFNVESVFGAVDYITLPEDTYLRWEIRVRQLRGDTLRAGFGYFAV